MEEMGKRVVRTVRVRNISDLATEREVREFFSFSGDIEHVDIRFDGVATGRTAYVTFKDPKALEIALLLSGATIVDQVVNITPAEDYIYIPVAEQQLLVNEVTSTSSDPNAELENSLEANASPNSRVYVSKAHDVMTNVIARGSAIRQDDSTLCTLREPVGAARPAMSSSRFSPALQASDLNDFIAPSQDCVISLNKNSSAARRLQIKQKENTVSTKPPEEAVKISLKDCLACSGCITSAETVMLEKQSLGDFIARINSGKTVIVSVSPQSRASLAAFFGLSQSQVLRKLTALFKSMGVKAVYDTSSSRDLSLIEACNEFVSRYQKNQPSSGQEAGANLPMISSACPGWICYAEKTLGSYILPYISSVKSPQQAIGAAIKHHVVEKLGLKPYDVYHVTVMPCYDKKLEAVRDDFVFSVDGKEVTEVDSVLTTGEVLDLIQSKSLNFKTLEESSLDRLLTNVDEEGHLYGVSGGSGGYAEIVFRHAARAIYKREIEGPLDFRTLRNSDFREIALEVEGKPVLKFALCYGFRNLQNIVRKIKMGKCEYHFIEVMACPSGCLNGGGQIKPVQGQSAKELIQQLESVYTQDVSISDPFNNPITKRLYDEWLGQPGSENAKKYLHTDYHPVVKSVASQLQNW